MGPNGLKPCFLSARFGDALQKLVLVAKRVDELSMNKLQGKARAVPPSKYRQNRCSCPSA